MKKILFILVLFFITANVHSQDKFTFTVNDAPVKNVLEQLFKQSKKQYAIENNVSGYVTMSIENQSFDNALKLIFRACSDPLTYTLENNIYFVKVRSLSQLPIKSDSLPKTKEENTNNIVFERILLNHLDPLDLQIIFGPIIYNRQFNRFNSLGFGMGNMGGMNGSMNNGMNGSRNF